MRVFLALGVLLLCSFGMLAGAWITNFAGGQGEIFLWDVPRGELRATLMNEEQHGNDAGRPARH